MEAPTCRLCGHKHWSRVCGDVTKPVTVTQAVTATVTPSVTPKVPAIAAEVVALTAEVAMLKRQLAEAGAALAVTNKRPMTGAERVAKHRRSKGKG